MLVAVSFFRAGSHHRDMPHAERFSSLLAIRAVTMVDGLPRAASEDKICNFIHAKREVWEKFVARERVGLRF